MTQKQMISINDWVYQSEGNVVSDMDGEKVMLSIANGKYYNLGEAGGNIWELINECVSVSKIIVELLNQYEIDRNTCEAQVLDFLEMLQKENLIKVQNAVAE